MKSKTVWRNCSICGKRIQIEVYEDGHYEGAEYFGKIKMPIEGTGEHKVVDRLKIGNIEGDVISWTGKFEEIEDWECPKCFETMEKED